MMSLRPLALFVVAGLVCGSCGGESARECTSETSCLQGGAVGICAASCTGSDKSYCAFPVATAQCPGGLLWGVLAGENLDGQCVQTCGATDAGLSDASAIDAAVIADAGPPITLGEACSAAGPLVALQEKLFTCRPERLLAVGAQVGQQPPAATLAGDCFSEMANFVAGGSVGLGDAGALEACRLWVEMATCDDLDPGEASACDAVFVGTLPAGAACDIDRQCAGDTFCDHSIVATCGSCRARLPDGMACTSDQECHSRRCTDAGACGALVTQGGACSRNADCAGDMRCSGFECVPEPTWMVGTPCADKFDCDAVVGPLHCSTFGQACQVYGGVGAECFVDHDSCNEPGGLFCKQLGPVSFECTVATIVGAGAACGPGARCNAALSCRDDDNSGATPNKCVSLVSSGGSCAGDVCQALAQCTQGNCEAGGYTGLCPPP